MFLLRKRVFTALLIGLLSIAFFMQSALAAEFGGFGALPAQVEGEELRDWFVYEISEGESIEDVVVIKNNTDAAANFYVYSADSSNSSGGGFAAKQRSEEMSAVGSWINLNLEDESVAQKLQDDGSFLLSSGDSLEIPFELNVPEGVDVGEHTGGVMIEPANGASEDGSGLQLSLRTGVRVYITVPGVILRDLKISNFAVNNNPELVVYDSFLSVENLGNVSTSLDATLFVNNILFPEKSFVVERADYSVLRDVTADISFRFDKPLIGVYNLSAEAVYEKDGDEVVMKTENQIIYSFASTTVLLIFIGSIILILLIIILATRLVARNLFWKKCKLKSTDTANSIARKYGVPAKLITKKNKLKSNSLKNKFTILIPRKAFNNYEKKRRK